MAIERARGVTAIVVESRLEHSWFGQGGGSFGRVTRKCASCFAQDDSFMVGVESCESIRAGQAKDVAVAQGLA
jgi:hypothetical protein